LNQTELFPNRIPGFQKPNRHKKSILHIPSLQAMSIKCFNDIVTYMILQHQTNCHIIIIIILIPS